MTSGKIVILMPVYNDWESAALVLAHLDSIVSRLHRDVSVLIVDDGSKAGPATPFGSTSFNSLSKIEILQLRSNLGHQRAIAIGLSFLYVETDCSIVVVMDADGEDRPEDVLRLYDRFAEAESREVVFA